MSGDCPSRDDRGLRDLLADVRVVLLAQVEVEVASSDDRVDHCTKCGSECGPQAEDLCPECGEGNALISTRSPGQGERYQTGERYDETSAAGRWDLDSRAELADLVRRLDAAIGVPQLEPSKE